MKKQGQYSGTKIRKFRNSRNKSENIRIISSKRYTPQQYNKKTVKIGQGLDFLKFWRGKWRETIGKAKEKLGKSRKNWENPRISGPYFLIRNVLLPFFGVYTAHL